MKIRLLTSITHKAPSWIQKGYQEYSKRLPPAYALELLEIIADKNDRDDKKLSQLIKPSHHVIALDAKGSLWTTEKLAEQLKDWQQAGRPVDLIIGGPDGLSPGILKRAQHIWSLSPLTFPHHLVKLLVAEQLYRAWSILNQHPYHR